MTYFSFYRGAHELGDRQWAYCNELADMCGKKRIPNHVRLLYDFITQARFTNLHNYKNEEYCLAAMARSINVISSRKTVGIVVDVRYHDYKHALYLCHFDFDFDSCVIN